MTAPEIDHSLAIDRFDLLDWLSVTGAGDLDPVTDPQPIQDPSVADWRHEAACRGVTDPEIFFPLGVRDTARAAKTICNGCPVSEACGRHAIQTGERFAVMAGFRMSDSDERDDLRLWLGMDPVGEMRTVTCYCGTVFQTTNSRRRSCPECRGMVPLERVRLELDKLLDEGWTLRRIHRATRIPLSTLGELISTRPGREVCDSAILGQLSELARHGEVRSV